MNGRHFKCDECGCLLWTLGETKEGAKCLHCENGNYHEAAEPESFHNFGNVDHPTVSC